MGDRSRAMTITKSGTIAVGRIYCINQKYSKSILLRKPRGELKIYRQ